MTCHFFSVAWMLHNTSCFVPAQVAKSGEYGQRSSDKRCSSRQAHAGKRGRGRNMTFRSRTHLLSLALSHCRFRTKERTRLCHSVKKTHRATSAFLVFENEKNFLLFRHARGESFTIEIRAALRSALDSQTLYC